MNKAYTQILEFISELEDEWDKQFSRHQNDCRFSLDSIPYATWRKRVKKFISENYSAEDIADILEIINISFLEEDKVNGLIGNLQYLSELPSIEPNKKNEAKTAPIEYLHTLFNRFHKVAQQLKIRRNEKGGVAGQTLIIKNEYDAQNLMRALLNLFFDDIRSEESTPSHAGACSRTDFLLKDEQIIIEIKKTRDTLKDKEIGDELLADIARYKSHPDCKKLICFVYDPDSFIRNPKGLIKDLAKGSEDFVQVIIKPDN